nr:DUF6708 domain-containing protein [Burkholderia ubonensis]
MKSWIAWLLVRNNGVVMSGRYLPEPAWTPSEQLNRSGLEQSQRYFVEPSTLGSVIEFNESYMDVVDWAYQKVGPVEIIWVFVFFLQAGFLAYLYVDTIFGQSNQNALFYNSFSTVAFLPGVIWFSRILYNTFTGCTHYPVRLDRKNQMVHVFRHNGEDGVSSYRWRDITFGMIGGGALQRSFVKGVMAGYVRRPDGSYDYFRLGVMWPTEEGMRGQWEYFRRYMEEGPGSLPEPEILLPIEGKRESFRMGAQLCWFLAGPMLGPAIFRLDRKNQMVHVFRHNGEDGVSSYRWRDITFGMIGGGALQRSFVKGVMAGYVRRPDGSYDYFRLGVMWPTEEGMRGQWEYFRRYMEEGPDSLPEPEILLPIENKRESFRMGAQLCWFLAGPMLGPAIFLAPLTVPGSLLRWFIMHVTRCLPRWPQHIMDICPISADDKYAHKPPNRQPAALVHHARHAVPAALAAAHHGYLSDFRRRQIRTQAAQIVPHGRATVLVPGRPDARSGDLPCTAHRARQPAALVHHARHAPPAALAAAHRGSLPDFCRRQIRTQAAQVAGRVAGPGVLRDRWCARARCRADLVVRRLAVAAGLSLTCLQGVRIAVRPANDFIEKASRRRCRVRRARRLVDPLCGRRCVVRGAVPVPDRRQRAARRVCAADDVLSEHCRRLACRRNARSRHH